MRPGSWPCRSALRKDGGPAEPSRWGEQETGACPSPARIRRSPWCAAWTSPANSSPRQCAVQSTKFSTCPTNGSDKAVPVVPRCPRCAQPMRLVRRTPRFGGLPDLYTFECRSCEISHTEESGPARWRDTDLFRLFSKQARECRRLATLAQHSEDRSFWLRLSEHWLKLAQGAGQRTS
jgi:hypothetical protein